MERRGEEEERQQSSSGVRRHIDRGRYSLCWLWLQAALQVTNPSVTSAPHLLPYRWRAPRAPPKRAAEGAMKKDEQSKEQRLKGAQELCLLRGRVAK